MALSASANFQSQIIQLTRPAAGQSVSVAADSGATLKLGFAPDAAGTEASGKDLVFAFPDGGRIVVAGFFDKGVDALPNLEMSDGATLSGQDFLNAFNPDLLSTAAGPGAGAGTGSGGSGEYADDAGNLLSGVERLGSLLTDQWGGGAEIADVFLGATSAATAGAGAEIELAAGFESMPVVTPSITPSVAPSDEPPAPPVTPSGTPSDEPPAPPVAPSVQLLAHDNVRSVTPVFGAPQIEKSASSTEISLDAALLDRTGQEGPGNPPTGVLQMFSASGDIEQDFGQYFASGTDIGDVVNALMRADTSWLGGNSGSAGVLLDLGTLDGDCAISFNWEFDSHNSGHKDVEPDAAFYVLLDANGNVVQSGLIAQFDYTRNGREVLDGKISIDLDDALPAGQYKLLVGIAEEEDNKGQKPTLTIEGLTTGTAATEIVPYVLAIEGNVITNAMLGSMLDMPLPNVPAHDQGIDHRSDDGDMTGAKISGFAIGSDMYTFADGNPVDADHGRYISVDNPAGTGGTFVMYEDGYYTFHQNGTGTPPSIDNLNISYTVQIHDPVQGDISGTADLHIRTDDHVFHAADGSAHGGDGNDIVYGSAGDDIISDGVGSDILYGGAGGDIFAWSANDYAPDATDKIMDFSFGQDKLKFEDLFASDPGHMLTEGNLVHLMETGKTGDIDGLKLYAQGGDVLAIEHGGQTVEIHGLSTDQVSTLTGSDTDAAAQMLIQMLVTTG